MFSCRFSKETKEPDGTSKESNKYLFDSFLSKETFELVSSFLLLLFLKKYPRYVLSDTRQFKSLMTCNTKTRTYANFVTPALKSPSLVATFYMNV